MSYLSKPVGNSETLHNLQTALATGKLSHAVLLCGPAGTGCNYVARCLAAEYLFPGGGAGAEAVLANTSPEVLLVEGEGKSGNIKVDRIRAIRSDIFHSALSAAGRVVLIRGAHRMAAPALNALLKVLEEPPQNVLFILTSHDAAALPETIRSRCAVYPVSSVSIQECTAALEAALPVGADASLLPLLAAVYGGRIGLGLAVLQNPQRLALLRNALALARAAIAGDAYSLLATFSHYEGRADDDREKRDALLADMAAVLAASLRGYTAEGLPHTTPAKAAALIPPIQNARQKLARNVAFKITATALVAQLRAV